MDLREEILREHSKHQAMRIAAWVGTDEKKFTELMTLFLGDEYRITQRAAWAVRHCFEAHPRLIWPYLPQMVRLLNLDVSVAVKRNTAGILQDLELPMELQGEAAEYCFKLLASKDEPVAIKVFAMTILGNICEHVPELAGELTLLIEEQLPYGSAGYRSRAKKTLQKLQKLQHNG